MRGGASLRLDPAQYWTCERLFLKLGSKRGDILLDASIGSKLKACGDKLKTWLPKK